MFVHFLFLFVFFRYSAVKGFVQLISETNDYAGQRELIAEYLEAEVHTMIHVLHNKLYRW